MFDRAQGLVLGTERRWDQQGIAGTAAGAVEAAGDASTVALELLDAADDVELAGALSAGHAIAFARTRDAEQGDASLATKDRAATRCLVAQPDEVAQFHVQPPALPLAHAGPPSGRSFRELWKYVCRTHPTQMQEES